MSKLYNFSKFWAIEPSQLQNISSSLNEKLAGLSVLQDKFLADTYSVKKRGDIAIIPVHGVITPRLDLFTVIFGGTALETLARDLETALNDDEIKGIILDIDSPGGVAVGPSEMADLIYKARSKKTIWAYAGRTCCSAAYWLASATDKIIAHKSALLGSIGVVSTVPVQEKPDESGYKNIEVVSSNAKNKRPDPRTPEGMSEIRRELDSLENEFINSIAKYRNTTTDLVRADFGQGGVLIGTEAVKISMADSLGTYEDTLKALSAEVSNNQRKGKNQMSENKGITKDDISADFLNKECPEIVKALKEEGFLNGKKAGFEEGAKAERDRLLAIDAVAIAGYEDLVAEARKNSEMTAEKLALKIVESEKSKGNSYLSSLKAAEAEMPKVSYSVSSEVATKNNMPIEDKAAEDWNSNPELRTEFGNDKEAYLAYCQANAAGLIKQISK